MSMRSIVLATIILATILISAIFLLTTENRKRIVIASTTTSLYATGLLEKLAQEFNRKHPDISIYFIPLGSGEALKRAEKGDVTIVISHAPSLEKNYLEKGILEEGFIIAYNYFVIVGPPDDPANIRGLPSLVALRKIAEEGIGGKAFFVSRGDRSGTHMRELLLWRKAGVRPSGSWYLESGAGMAETLLLASEKKAYTISDTGTFLKLRKEGLIDLEVLVHEDNALINIYSIYLVNPQIAEGDAEAAMLFINFITSKEGQGIIQHYGIAEYGQPLFYPARNDENRLKIAWNKIASMGGG